MNEVKTIGELLKHYRDKNGLKASYVAGKVSMSVVQYYRRERNEVGVSLEDYLVLRNILKIDKEWSELEKYYG